VFQAAIPTLADLQGGQQRLFWGRMWICISACEYLVIWCDKTTVHEITDCSSIKQTPSVIHKLQPVKTKHCINGNIFDTVYKLQLEQVSEKSHLLYCFSCNYSRLYFSSLRHVSTSNGHHQAICLRQNCRTI
jgi:hypothetical protein